MCTNCPFSDATVCDMFEDLIPNHIWFLGNDQFFMQCNFSLLTLSLLFYVRPRHKYSYAKLCNIAATSCHKYVTCSIIWELPQRIWFYHFLEDVLCTCELLSFCQRWMSDDISFIIKVVVSSNLCLSCKKKKKRVTYAYIDLKLLWLDIFYVMAWKGCLSNACEAPNMDLWSFLDKY